MKYCISVNQERAMEAGIRNITTAHILDLLTTCSSWATPQERDGHVYYWVSRQSICRELPLLNIKPDTAYRHLKKLADLKLIDYQKDGKKDLVRLTTKGKKYHSAGHKKNEDDDNAYVGNKSELSGNESRLTEEIATESCDLDVQNAEKHYVGNKSEPLNNDYIGNNSEKGANPYVGNKSEQGQNSDLDPEKLGFKSEKARKKIRQIPNTRSIRNTNDHADGEYSNIGSDIRFAMHDEWQPSSDHFPVLCRRAGLVDWQTYHTQETLTEFILYWSGQASELTQYNWELKYLKQLQRSKARGNAHGNQNQSGGNEPKKSRYVDENDTSFLVEDESTRQVAGLK